MILSDGLLCWHVTIEDTDVHTYARTRGAAKWKVISHWREAGCGSDGRWPAIHAVRDPRYDTHPNRSRQHASVFGSEDFR